DLPPGLLALAQALRVTERQLHGSLLNMRRVVSRICGALIRPSLGKRKQTRREIFVAEIEQVPSTSPVAGCRQ
ncbi:hypothetical protein, partial [Xanthomonas vasicola]|uniref:hypothetical protein n=1 Tax=Xanthomonas vasicola TaxID=56459 RepID=UPI001C724C3F